jgi:hypothetical protein
MKKIIISLILILLVGCDTTVTRTLQSKDGYFIIEGTDMANLKDYGKYYHTLIQVFDGRVVQTRYYIYSDSMYRIGDTLKIVKL